MKTLIRKSTVALAPLILGLGLFWQGVGDTVPEIRASEALQVFGGDAGASQTCNIGAVMASGTDCQGACANNMIYTSTGANGEAPAEVTCGSCGGRYKGKVPCYRPD